MKVQIEILDRQVDVIKSALAYMAMECRKRAEDAKKEAEIMKNTEYRHDADKIAETWELRAWEAETCMNWLGTAPACSPEGVGKNEKV